MNVNMYIDHILFLLSFQNICSFNFQSGSNKYSKVQKFKSFSTNDLAHIHISSTVRSYNLATQKTLIFKLFISLYKQRLLNTQRTFTSSSTYLTIYFYNSLPDVLGKQTLPITHSHKIDLK